MGRKNRRSHNKGKDISNMDVNTLSMVNPTVIGTPLGMLPIMPVPTLDPDDYKKNPDINDDTNRLP